MIRYSMNQLKIDISRRCLLKCRLNNLNDEIILSDITLFSSDQILMFLSTDSKLDKFKGLASVQAKDGASCLFWDDCWVGQPLKLSFPELFYFAKRPIISCKSVFTASPHCGLFNLPLSVQAFAQFQGLQQIIRNLHCRNPALCRVSSGLPSIFFRHSAKSAKKITRKKHSPKRILCGV